MEVMNLISLSPRLERLLTIFLFTPPAHIFILPGFDSFKISDEEVLKMRLEKIKVETDIEVGDTVEIVEGALDKMIGKVIAVNPDNNQLTVAVEMFGRENNVELTFEQVHKVQK